MKKFKLVVISASALMLTVTSAYAFKGFGGYGGDCPYGNTPQNLQQRSTDTVRQQDMQKLQTRDQLRIHVPTDAQSIGAQTRAGNGFKRFGK